MPARPDQDCFIIVVDTNKYAGNFERTMCAYVTGAIGECGVGREGQQAYADDHPLWDPDDVDDLMLMVADEHGCERPCSIWPTPDWFNDGSGGHFRDDTYEGGSKYPAYMSVAMFFRRYPTPEEFGDFCDRIKAFPAWLSALHTSRGRPSVKGLHVENIRLLRYEIKVTEETLSTSNG